MSLIGFLSHSELLSIGLLEGEPTKGPWPKTIESIRPSCIFFITRENQEMEGIKKYIPAHIKTTVLPLPEGAFSSVTSLVEALKAEEALLADWAQAGIVNTGSPQERAALWVLRHEGLLKGNMIEPPGDYWMPLSLPAPVLQAAEEAKPFGEKITPETSVPWEAAAQRAGCLGKSPRFRQTLEEAAALAGHPTPILLMGETGSGKEVLARFIHTLSSRGTKTMVTVNCAALPEQLAESILFGHEKGAFTGAYKRQKGKFEQAHGSTLFLDELGELSLANQAKLLRVLETRSVDLLGGGELVDVDVRVIAATNRNLAQEVAAGRFREDLYYRLRGGEIHIPPLRERSSDIPVIALHLLERMNATLAQPKQFAKNALKFLESQTWQGNVRDLMNTIERAVLMSPRQVIEAEDFKINPSETSKGNGRDGLPALYQGFEMEAYLQKIRHDLFEKALKQAGGNKSEAARLLGISPQAIHKYFKQLEQKELQETL